jgi:hypothetical protein
MSDLRDAAEKALKALEHAEEDGNCEYGATAALRAALKQPEQTLTDEVIADLWHQNGGFHHHFARAVERYLKGEK